MLLLESPTTRSIASMNSCHAITLRPGRNGLAPDHPEGDTRTLSCELWCDIVEMTRQRDAERPDDPQNPVTTHDRAGGFETLTQGSKYQMLNDLFSMQDKVCVITGGSRG